LQHGAGGSNEKLVPASSLHDGLKVSFQESVWLFSSEVINTILL